MGGYCTSDYPLDLLKVNGENVVGRWVVRTVTDKGYMTILVISKLGDSWGWDK